MNEPMPTGADLARTLAVLDELQAEQERLHAGLEASGLTRFSERWEWLFWHASEERRVAWRRYWLDLGVLEPAPVRVVRSVWVERGPGEVRPCRRCGVERVIRHGRDRGLCRDCISVLSREEIERWVA